MYFPSGGSNCPSIVQTYLVMRSSNATDTSHQTFVKVSTNSNTLVMSSRKSFAFTQFTFICELKSKSYANSRVEICDIVLLKRCFSFYKYFTFVFGGFLRCLLTYKESTYVLPRLHKWTLNQVHSSVIPYNFSNRKHGYSYFCQPYSSLQIF